jgi:glycosyltransferase involved in cell wall biosynthesis
MLQVNFQGQVCVNARVTAFAMGGQQRVAAEIMKRLPGMQQIAPKKPLSGLKGHAWEQAVLPRLAKGRLLWSPSATGPLVQSNQVVTVHDTAFIDHPEFFSPSFVKLYTALIPRLVHRAAVTVTVSEFSRNRLAKLAGIPLERIQVIYNGVADHFRLYSASEIEATRAALKLPQRYVLCQATSDKRKNLVGTVEAWRAVRSQLPPDIKLVIAGNLGRAHVFGAMDITIDDPDIHLTGYVAEEHMGPLLAGAEVFLFPSLYEGFGLPLVEAMATGTPVITGNTTALPEVAGQAARLVDATNPRELGEAMVALLSDSNARSALRAKGLRRAAHFTWDKAARDYEWTFQRLMTAQTLRQRDVAAGMRERHAPWP